MNSALLSWLTVIGTGCWAVCFWWMHRISSRQDAMLQELQEQGRRVERLSREEHDLIKEIHPKVKNIEGDVSDVADAVKTKSA
jgi:hypothetical protein